ncbi:hypothetical protein V6N12_002401 [Hibiscus sabdariffa]|uniref:DUF7731 domain-containing protein n=1 Tax=Hibiscus sabdariffa TaxID=183260 RepID=A0ABR2B494_9ROSI
MAAPTASKLKRFTSFNLLIIVAIFCHNVRSGNAQNFPAQSLPKAFFCFNNKYIYTGCNEAYRLNESGDLNIPREATDVFCNGPCLAETQLVLKCVDNVLSGFVFYNKATIRDITNVLRAGCSNTNTRGRNKRSIEIARVLYDQLVYFNTNYWSLCFDIIAALWLY